MSEVYKQKFKARWGDMDFNAHMANTAYLDVCSDVRMLYFEEHGFTMRDFERLMIGPMVMKDEIEYFREIRLLEHFEVHQIMAGLSEDRTRHRFRNIFYRADGEKAAVITSTAGFVDLRQRRLVAPPDKLREAMESLERSEDFEVLPNSVK
jgi:acyl-CoA thioester hydrolase